MITIVGLGPGEFDRVSAPARSLLLDLAKTVVARTEHHPSARQLGDLRDVVFCDDLYESGGTFEDVYEAIARRVVEASKSGHVVYAVPGVFRSSMATIWLTLLSWTSRRSSANSIDPRFSRTFAPRWTV